MRTFTLTSRFGVVLLGLIAVSSVATAETPASPKALMCIPGELIFSDDFDPASVSDRWFFKADFALRDGALLRTDIDPTETKRVFLKDPSFHNTIIQFDFKLSGQTTDLRLVTGSGGHYNSVTQIHPDHFQVNTPVDRDAGLVPAQLGECIRRPRPDQWQTMTVEYWGDEIVAHLSETEFVLGRHPIIDRTRQYFAFQFDLPGASIDNVRVWKARGQREDWSEARKTLAMVQADRAPVTRDPAEQYKLEYMNLRSRLTLEDQIYRDLVAKREQLEAALHADYPEAFITHKQLGKLIATKKQHIKDTEPDFKRMETRVHKASRAEDDYVLSTKPELARLKQDGVNRNRFPSELGQVRAQLQAIGDKQLAALIAETARRQAELEARYPDAFQSVDAAVEKRNAIRKSLNNDPEFQARNKAVVDAGKAIKNYEHKAAPNLAKLEAASKDYLLKPVPFNEVEMTSDFWRPRLETQRKTLVPFAFERTQPGVEHLKAARDFLAGKKVEDHRAHRFIDSDLYKVMEGAAYLLQLRRDPELEARLDELADIIAGAQEANGYLYPSHTTGVGTSKNMMGDAPYTFVVHSHELYNVGHLYEAAIAYYQATGKRKLLDVAERSAQHINQVFFVGDPKYNDGKPIRQAPGHQELELALVRLHRVTGKQLYLDMARKFLEIRGLTYMPDGEGVMSPTYAQQHAPVARQREAVGHAVRATYLYSAMADVGTLTGEPGYGHALDHIWGDITNTRMHITGGLGAVHGIEGFGPQYELPNSDAFNETCAAVGNVLFNYRMFLLHKDAKYLDVAEVSLLNNVLAAVNLEGNRFFYVNPLEADGKYPFNHGTAGRAPWFGTACCPSNMARLLPQVPGMTYAHDNRDVYISFYADSRTEITLDDVKVELRQQTAYPNDGEISLVVSPARPTKFRVLLRIPTWARDRFVPGELYRYVDTALPEWSLTVNGEEASLQLDKGFVAIDRHWQAGDRVRLTLPMPVRISECHPAVKANQNRIALTRGPFVLCAEGVDHGGPTQRFFFAGQPDVADAEVSTKTIDAGSFLQVRTVAQAVAADNSIENSPLVLTPYYAWNNRGVSSMTVWFPRDEKLAVFDPHSLPKESVFASVTASHTFADDTVTAIGDGKEPRYSSGKKVPRWTSRPQKNDPQWVEARFHATKRLRSVGVYWMQDQFDVKFPAEWSLEVEQNGNWTPFELYTTDRYDTRANQYNVVHPAAPIRCDAIRVRMVPKQDACVGILEIIAEFEKE